MDYIYVGIAGFFGAITRAFIGKIVLFRGSNFPINTFIINLTGSLILSFFLTITLDRLKVNPRLRLAITTGFLGAYTTFSTFAVKTINLIKKGYIIIGFIYVLGSTVGGLIAAWIGLSLAKYIEYYSERENETQEGQNN